MLEEVSIFPSTVIMFQYVPYNLILSTYMIDWSLPGRCHDDKITLFNIYWQHSYYNHVDHNVISPVVTKVYNFIMKKVYFTLLYVMLNFNTININI